MKAKKKRNPADLTKRNNDARKKEIEQIKFELDQLWAIVKQLERGLRKANGW